MQKDIYVYYDNVSSHIISRGVSFCMGMNSIQMALPKNILILDGATDLAIYDDYTGFSYIKEPEKVTAFLERAVESSCQVGDWIDFESLDFLHQLTAQEVAELLYLSHANNHLHSPFFYKLQNNYVYLSMDSEFTKVYYRHIHPFYGLLAASMRVKLVEALSEQQKWWQKLGSTTEVTEMPIQLVEQMGVLFKEGILISFKHMQTDEGFYKIPIFLAEDTLAYMPTSIDTRLMGWVEYKQADGSWMLQLQSRMSE